MLSGFWSDLWDSAQAETQDAITNKISAQYGSDHIAAQNAAVADMGQALNLFNASGSSDFITIENRILSIARNFASYAATFNTARAMRGAAEVTALAKQIVSDLEARRMGTAQWTDGFSGFSALPGWVLPAGLLAGAFFILPKMMKGKRR